MHKGAVYFPRVERIGPRKPTQWFLREWRTSRGWSVREMARRMETSPATISKLETGVQAWDSAWLARAAWAFGLEDDTALLRMPGAPTPDELLARATPDQRRAVMDFIEFTLKRGPGGRWPKKVSPQETLRLPLLFRRAKHLP